MNIYKYDIKKIKEQLTTDQIYQLLEELGGEPEMDNNKIICKTICHNGHSHKLFYYINTGLAKCFTECNEVMDIFEITRRALSFINNKKIEIADAIKYVCSYFGINAYTVTDMNTANWKQLNKYKTLNKTPQQIRMKSFDEQYYNHLPIVNLEIWKKEHITEAAMRAANIRFNPRENSIVIPHYDINGNLVGIRNRFLAQEDIINGKYKPAFINQQLYAHPLSFNLYNLNLSKDNIKKVQTAIIFESEKSCLQYKSYYPDNDISVAVCGSNISTYQFNLLFNLGVREIIIAFDRQWQKWGDKEWFQHRALLESIQQKYEKYCIINYIEDYLGQYLDYKDSPTDKGKEVFEKLLKQKGKL